MASWLSLPEVKRSFPVLHLITSLTVIAPCNHKRVDTRILLHVRDATTPSEFTKVGLKTVDKDVMAISIGVFEGIEGLDKFWVFLGYWCESSGLCHSRHFPWLKQIKSLTCVSCLYRLWHCFKLLRQGGEVCLANMDPLWWCYSSISGLLVYEWGQSRTDRVICSSVLWPY